MTTMNRPFDLPAPARRIRSGAAWLAAALLAAGCAVIAPASMRLPEPLAAASHDTLRGLDGRRSGEFSLAGASGRFERDATSLSLFGLVERNRATARYALRWADGREVEGRCKGRETGVSIGIVGGRAQPFSLNCEWSGTVAALSVADSGFIGAAAGTRSERRGTLRAGAVELEVQSVHHVEGSPLPLDAPIGYVVRHRGVAVGAVELNGGSPRVWRPAEGDALREPVTLALLALALVWDPAA